MAAHGVGPEPLQLDVVGPVASEVLPPVDPPAGALARVVHAFELWLGWGAGPGR